MEDMETGSLSTNTDQILVQDLQNHIQVDNPQFNYVHIIYHNVVSTDTHLDFETGEWKPTLQKAVDERKPTVQGWGNGRILSPQSDDFPYTAFSSDLFGTAKDALGSYFSEMVVPDDFGASVADKTAG